MLTSKERVTWRGGIRRNCFPDLNQSSVLLLNFCVKCGLSITNTMLEHRMVQNVLGIRLTWAKGRWMIF